MWKLFALVCLLAVGPCTANPLAELAQRTIQGVVSRAERAANVFAEKKEVVTITLAAKPAENTIKFGAKKPADIKTTLVTLDYPVNYAYDKTACAGTTCRDPAPSNFYEPDDATVKQDSWTFGSFKGKSYTDQLTIDGKALTVEIGDVTSVGPKDWADALVGLGPGGSTVTALFDLGPEKSILIQKDKAVSKLNVGAKTVDGCDKNVEFYDIAQDSDKTPQWWIADVEVTVDGEASGKLNAQFDLYGDKLGLPKKLIDKIGGKVDKLDALKDLSIKIGARTFVLKPKDYTSSSDDKSYDPLVEESKDTISLGAPFLKKYCVSLASGDKNQIGIAYPNSAASSALSVGALLSVAFFWLRL